MAIQMIGIDHSVAAIDIRTIFSFTQKKTVEALEIIKQEKGICGCVLLSTCNPYGTLGQHGRGVCDRPL